MGDGVCIQKVKYPLSSYYTSVSFSSFTRISTYSSARTLNPFIYKIYAHFENPRLVYILYRKCLLRGDAIDIL